MDTGVFVRIESSQFIKGESTSEGHNDIYIEHADAKHPDNSAVEFVCPRGTTGAPFVCPRGNTSVLELPPTKQVVSCK